MKKGSIIQGTVEYTGFPNKGILHADGEKVTVKGCIPGQKIEARIIRAREGRAEGTLLSVLEPSPLENAVPECPHFGPCGGCSLSTLPYEEQRKLKEGQVRRLLEPYLTPETEWLPGNPSPKPLRYRNKMEFSFGDEYKDGPLSLGLHRKGSFYDIVETSGCRLMHEDLAAVYRVVFDWAKEYRLDFFHRMTGEGYLRHLLLRRAEHTGEILIDLITTSKEEPVLARLTERLLSLEQGGELSGSIVGILHTVNDREGDAIVNQGTEVLHGRDYLYEELLGLRFRVSIFSFFQTNSLGAEVLYESVRNMVSGKHGVLFDLYSGTGTIGQLLAPVCDRVIGVELIPEAVAAARVNAELNGLTNCTFLAGDVLKMLDEIPEKPDYIILDPPREGVVPKALRKILAYGVDSIIYISCKPTSLARDIPEFLAAGYTLKKVQCTDMFPQGPNVETVVLLSREKVDGHIDIDPDVEKLYQKGKN